MKCEKCGKNEATAYYKVTVNGRSQEVRVCADCARALHLGGALQGAFVGMTQGFGSFFPSLLGGDPFARAAAETERVCPTCGRTERELRQTGRAGCPDCYHAFEDILNPYIRRLQGTDTHVGVRPQEDARAGAPSAESLRAALRHAVQTENYEEAARLRDELRGREGEGA